QELREPRAILPDSHGLQRVGTAVGLDSRGFASPDELRAADAEVPPAAENMCGRRSVTVRIPAFHRMNAPAIANSIRTELERPGQRTPRLCCQDSVIDG